MKNSQTAQTSAQELLSQAIENEPTITEDLREITKEVSAEMVGLENKFKSEESLKEKLLVLAELRSQTIEEASESINDGLRYTFIFSVENYANSFQTTIELLWEKGYYIPEKRIWNAWKNIGTVFDKGYRGINVTVISSQNQKFELQFHTAESFRLKNETHHLYKKMRDKNISQERVTEIVKMMKVKASKIKRPKGM